MENTFVVTQIIVYKFSDILRYLMFIIRIKNELIIFNQEKCCFYKNYNSVVLFLLILWGR